ncbi:LacI family DNA-binding transcriptional regulator [Cognatishimia sp. WU-CL00825]|uniref:LacI family DNA-binding transcriptional regulator n=1 Tax=Cognatishimia sp. WU-CL00825 TaxID=3127658 RepID=UPI00310A9D73
MQDKKKIKRANLRDVARAADVSVATVSRVLNTPNSVAPNTRDKVQAVITELRFTPSAAARAINSGRTRFVGALVPTLDNAIFARFLAALENRLDDFGLSCVVATTQESAEAEVRKAKSLLDIGAEGLILSGVSHAPELFETVRQAQLPTLATSYFDVSAPLPTIGYDNEHAARMGLTHLLELGHTKIAIIHGPAAHNDRTGARLAGIHSLNCQTLSFHEAEISMQGGCGAAQDIADLVDKPSALFCLSDVLAMGALFELQRLGYKIPKDFSILGMDDLPSARHTFPALTTIHLPVRRMGEKAGTAMGDWLENNVVPQPEMLEVKLEIRGSTLPL